MRRVAVIGLDGATWSVLEPMLEDGAMPTLAALLDRSARGVLWSTVPPYTPPAWTSAVTGVNPGRHGIFGFVQGRDGHRLIHWGSVRAPALWHHLEARGHTVGLFHLPLTFPPPRVHGWSVGAVWMPTAKGVTGFTHPREIETRIRALVPVYEPVTGVERLADWRDPGLAERVTATVRSRRVILSDLLERRPVDVVWAVLEAPDRLHHAYYKYLDPSEPLSRTPAARDVRRAAGSAFAALDEVVGLLDEYAGRGGVAVVCSDHGATGWNGYVFGNALLRTAGLLRLRRPGRALSLMGASRHGGPARRLLPASLTYRLRRWVQATVDYPNTLAYADRLGTQGFSVNLAGREPNGSVGADDFDVVMERTAGVLRATRSPDGSSVFSAVRRREDVYHGPYVMDAPDLLVEPAGWRWEVSDGVAARDVFEDLSALPLGCHHPAGVFSLRAPGVAATTGVSASIMDVLPTLLYAAGEPVPVGLDGEARRDLFGPASPSVAKAPALAIPPPASDSAYSAEEEALITRYLTDLGYLG